MKNWLSYHWQILADPDVYFGLDREVWRHIFWLVDLEKTVTLEWINGEWRNRVMANKEGLVKGKRLSTEDAGWISELTFDKKSIERQLSHILGVMQNQMAGVMRSEKKFWDHAREAYGLDRSKVYLVDYSRDERQYFFYEDVGGGDGY